MVDFRFYLCLTLKYFSMDDSCLSSSPSSNAVSIGSLLDREMYASLANPRYAFSLQNIRQIVYKIPESKEGNYHP